MKKKSFFNKSKIYNREGKRFATKLERFITPLVSTYAKKGYSIIEIKHMIHNTTAFSCCLQKLGPGINAALKKYRAAKEKNKTSKATWC